MARKKVSTQLKTFYAFEEAALFLINDLILLTMLSSRVMVTFLSRKAERNWSSLSEEHPKKDSKVYVHILDSLKILLLVTSN